MLRNHALRAASASRPLEFAYLSTSTGDTSASQTFSSVSFGDPSPTRRIYVAVNASSTTSGRTISSVTIGGVSATLVGKKDSTGSIGSGVSGIAVADVPSGTSGNVVVTFSGTLTTVKRIHVYRVINQKATLATVLFSFDFNQNFAGTSGSEDTTSENGGFALGSVAWLVAQNPTLTSAGWTRDVLGSGLNIYASRYTTGGDLTVSWSWPDSAGWNVSLYTFRA